LYSIAFGTDTKTAEPIEMPFGIMGVQIPQREGAIFGGCAGHSKALAIFGAAVAAAFAAKAHSIANNVIQPKGSFSTPGKRKLESGKFWAQAMRTIGRERGVGSAQRGRSLISTTLLFNKWYYGY